MPKCNIFTYFFDNFLLTILKKCFIIQLRKILPQNPERTTAMLLNKNWKMLFNGEILPCRGFPVSMYRTLLANGRIDDPYYGENQYDAKELSRKDCEFICEFEPEGEIFAEDKVFLRFFGIDTLSEVYLNGNILFGADNMFVTYEYEVRGLLKRGLNTLRVKISSPLEYAEKRFGERPLYGVEGTVPGYQHIRKAHYMYGWDWGMQLPDMGIWRNVEIVGKSVCEICGAYYRQEFRDSYRKLILTVTPELRPFVIRPVELLTEIELSDGRSLISRNPVHKCERLTFEVENPPLWWVRGYGKQPLQRVKFTLIEDGKAIDRFEERIGFRELTVRNDEKAGKFCFVCNGTEIFAMGANIIPEDQILPSVNDKRTDYMLRQCARANFNCVRVWGGGVYPNDHFLKRCDELGFVLWQDFMFACAAYRLTPQMAASVKKELKDNIKRIRNHPCLGLWCGNNEIESMWEGWGVPKDEEAKADYAELFEKIIPAALKEYDPDRFYWPSSPSSGGGLYGGKCFSGSSDNHRGDQHFWAVWHGFKPLEEFRRFDFPFCSEFGFESLPSVKTAMTFARGKDMDLCSPVMEAHQKCVMGNEKLLFYTAQMCRTPKSFEELVYATQLVQAESIRLNVEHMRRKRGKCMGSLYWQFNDSNPVISWSAVDYFGREKALYYATKRFYAPVLVSCLEENLNNVQLHISNETTESILGIIKWSLRKNTGGKIVNGEKEVQVEALSSEAVISLDLSKHLNTREMKRSCFLEYCLIINGKEVYKGCTIFVKPKAFEFLPPDFSLNIEETGRSYILKLKSRAFAKGVVLDLKDCDCVFSDNFFDFSGSYTVEVDKDSLTKPLTADGFRRRLCVMSCFDLGTNE